MPTAHANGIDIYYETHGEGPPLLLIGGLSTDITDLRRMISRLPPRHRVIAFDNRGAGRTDKPDVPYSIPMMADDAAGLLDVIGVKHTDVLGISMGGRIAVDLTLRHPSLVGKLILVSTHVGPHGAGTRRLLDVLEWIPFFRGSRKYPMPRYAMRRQREAVRTYDATDRLHEIVAPTLIMHGRRDRIASFEQAREMSRLIRGSWFVPFRGGHIFMMFEMQRFLDEVARFLASDPAA